MPIGIGSLSVYAGKGKAKTIEAMVRAKEHEGILRTLVKDYPELAVCRDEILRAFELLCGAYRQEKILYVLGNGGSAADSEHIVGELMKTFKLRRPVDPAVAVYLKDNYGEAGERLADKLEGALRAISLPSMLCVSTAFMNDSDPAAVFAQLVNGLGRKGDVLLAISTSGNSRNVILACMTAHARGMQVIGLTGEGGGRMKEYCDVLIRVPARETYAVQEMHLPVYHALCAMLENEFFGQV